MTDRSPSSDEFDAFFHSYHRRVRGLAARMVGADAADDVAQEVMLRAHAQFGEEGFDRPPWPWLSAVTRNVAADHYRRNRHWLPADDAVIEQFTPSADDAPAVTAVRADARRRLSRALSNLSQRDRTLLTEHEVHGVTVASIATTAGVSANSLRQRLFRARRELARHYQELGGQPLAVQPVAALASGRRAVRTFVERYAGVPAERVAAAVTAAVLVTGAPIPSHRDQPVPPRVPPVSGTREAAPEPGAGAVAEPDAAGPDAGETLRTLEELADEVRQWVTPPGELNDAGFYRYEAEDAGEMTCGDVVTVVDPGQASVAFGGGCEMLFPRTEEFVGMRAIQFRVEGTGCGFFRAYRGEKPIGLSARYCAVLDSPYATHNVSHFALPYADPSAPFRLVWWSEQGRVRAWLDWADFALLSKAGELLVGDRQQTCVSVACLDDPRVGGGGGMPQAPTPAPDGSPAPYGTATPDGAPALQTVDGGRRHPAGA